MLSITDITAISGVIIATFGVILVYLTYKREIKPEKEVSAILTMEVKSLREDVNIIKARIPVDQELKRQQFEEMKSQNSWNRLMGLGKLAKDLAPLFKEDDDD